MPTDNREGVLARMFALMATVPTVVSAVRNRGLRSNEDRPAMVLLDGDEFPRLSVDTRRIHGRGMMMAPQIVQLRPECYILLAEARPQNVNLGSELDAIRIAYMNKLWDDTQLATILGSNGSIVYNGCTTDLKSGSALSGQMRMDFIVNYVLKPAT